MSITKSPIVGLTQLLARFQLLSFIVVPLGKKPSTAVVEVPMHVVMPVKYFIAALLFASEGSAACLVFSR